MPAFLLRFGRKPKVLAVDNILNWLYDPAVNAKGTCWPQSDKLFFLFLEARASAFLRFL